MLIQKSQGPTIKGIEEDSANDLANGRGLGKGNDEPEMLWAGIIEIEEEIMNQTKAFPNIGW